MSEHIRAVASHFKAVGPKSHMSLAALGGSGGHAPLEIIFNDRCSEIASEAILGSEMPSVLQLLASRISIVAACPHCNIVIAHLSTHSNYMWEVSAGMPLRQKLCLEIASYIHVVLG